MKNSRPQESKFIVKSRFVSKTKNHQLFVLNDLRDFQILVFKISCFVFALSMLIYTINQLVN